VRVDDKGHLVELRVQLSLPVAYEAEHANARVDS
jgi:hypothetical protein